VDESDTGSANFFGPMRIVRAASEAEVVAAFLRGELTSDRWGDRLRAFLSEDGADQAVVERPNLDDPAECTYRETLLDRHRAWLRREGLFFGFPERVDWCRAALAPGEVLAIRYIDWDWWLRLSGGTRLPLDAAVRIRGGEIAGVTAESHEPAAARLRSTDPGPELIVVSLREGSPLVLLEGHVRLTAYALYPNYLPDELEIFLGTSEDMAAWSEF
jgi:hypothetical protein